MAMELAAGDPRVGGCDCDARRLRELLQEAGERYFATGKKNRFGASTLLEDFASGSDAPQSLTAPGGLNAMHGLNPFVVHRLVQHPLPPTPGQFVAAVIRPVLGQPVS